MSYTVDYSNKRDAEYLKEAIKFRHTFDGKVTKNSLEPLKFRNKCVNWYKRVKKARGYLPKHGALVLINAMTGESDETLNRTDDTEIETVEQFLEWFDSTFHVRDLRRVLHDQILKWKIDPKTPRNKIIDEFKAQIRLFDQSGYLATTTLKKHTEFTRERLTHTLTRQLKDYDKELWEQYKIQTTIDHKQPQTLQELEVVIRKCDVTLTDREIMQNKSNDNSNSWMFESDTTTNIGSVNAIDRNYNNYNNNRRNNNMNNNNRYNNNGSNYNNFNGYNRNNRGARQNRGRGRGESSRYYNNRGSRGRSRRGGRGRGR